MFVLCMCVCVCYVCVVVRRKDFCIMFGTVIKSIMENDILE